MAMTMSCSRKPRARCAGRSSAPSSHRWPARTAKLSTRWTSCSRGFEVARMCNLYRLTTANQAVAHLFDVIEGQVGNAGMGEVYPGRTGIVAAKGELRSMVWGFPLVLKGKDGKPLKPRPVN